MPSRCRLTISKRVPVRVPVKLLNKILGLTLKGHGQAGAGSCEISLAFISGRAMYRLNKRYRNVDKGTDVLSFSFLPGPRAGALIAQKGVARSIPVLVGEILINPTQAERQALALGHPVHTELALLFLHGLLHVLGYNHEKSRRSRLNMAGAEQKILSKIPVLKKQKGVIMRAKK